VTAQVERLLAAAERQVTAGRPGRALPLLRRAQRIDPGDARAAIRIAEIALETLPATDPRAARDALAALDAYLATPLRDPGEQPMRQRAQAARRSAIALGGEHGAAIDAALAAAGSQDERAAHELRGLATIAVQRGDLQRAQAALEGARRAMPQDPEVLADLAAVLVARGRAQEAVAVFEAVVARRPGDLDAIRDLAGARLAAGDARRAIALLDTVVVRLPDRADVRLDLARARLEAGDPEGAASAARESLERATSDDPEAALVLGQALVACGRRDEARSAYREALRRRPDSPRAREALRALESEPSP
jgi:Flp pilus assembly protein TadD